MIDNFISSLKIMGKLFFQRLDFLDNYLDIYLLVQFGNYL